MIESIVEMQRATNCLLKNNVIPVLRRSQEFYLNGKFGFGINGCKRRESIGKPVLHRAYMARAAQEPFLNGSSSVYVEEMYRAWLKDPNTVHKSWDAFFKSATAGVQPGLAYQSPPSLGSSAAAVPQLQPTTSLTPSQTDVTSVAHRDIDDHLSVQAIIRSYQVSISH